jgi:hypothetical protein
MELSASRRSLLKRGTILGGIAAIASAFSLIPQVSKASTTTATEKWQITPISDSTATKYINGLLTSPDYNNFKTFIQIKSALPLQEHQASASFFVRGQLKLAFVSVTNVQGEDRSAYVATFQLGSFTPSESLGYIMTDTTSQKTTFITVKDGKEIVNALLGADNKIIEGYLLNAQGKQVILDKTTVLQLHQQGTLKANSWTPCGGWGCMNDCLSSQGIAGKVIEVAGLICGATCLAGPEVCIPCILALGTISGGVTQYCANQCFC